MAHDSTNDELRVVEEDAYYSILITATQYARNAIFAGMMPSDIEKRFPKLWLNDDDEGGKINMRKSSWLISYNVFCKPIKFSYTKVTNFDAGKAMVDNIANMFQNKFNIIVYNFVDMLSHARTDMQVIRELADDEAAYRSLTVSWFEHSPLLEAIRKMVAKNVKVVISTDHGTIRVKEPSKLIGDRNTNTNLRYKQGKNLNYEKRDVFEVKNPADAMLPRNNFEHCICICKAG